MATKELNVIVKTKELCTYIFTVTASSPKKFRFTLVDRMLNTSLSAISYIYQANDVFIRNEQDVKRMEERVYYQRKAMTQLKLLGYLSHFALQQQCILPKQFEKISRMIYSSCNMLGGWINADLRRIKQMGQR